MQQTLPKARLVPVSAARASACRSRLAASSGGGLLWPVVRMDRARRTVAVQASESEILHDPVADLADVLVLDLEIARRTPHPQIILSRGLIPHATCWSRSGATCLAILRFSAMESKP